MYHVKNTFQHRSVKKTAMHCFNYATDLLHFMTEGNVCILALDMLSTGSQIADRDECLEQVSAQITETVWQDIFKLPGDENGTSEDDQDKVRRNDYDDDEYDSDGDGEYSYCYCKEGICPMTYFHEMSLKVCHM